MKNALCGVLFLTLAALASADVPKMIHYQGKLVENTGAIVVGPVSLRVRLYDHPTASSPELFDETHVAVPLSRGLFSILIGSVAPGGVPDSVVAGSTVYLGVSVDGSDELSPRSRIGSAPFAAKTRSAEQLVRPGTVDSAVVVDSSGKVGIGTITPVERVDINGAIRIGDTSESAAGTIRWTGTDFEGFDGTQWLSLTSPAPAAVSLTPEDQPGMNVSGPGVPAYGDYVTFTVTNTGRSSTGTLSSSLISGTQFELGTDTCNGVCLSSGQTCTIDVRPRLTEGQTGAISDTLQVSACPGGSATSDLSGTASNFNPAQLVILTPDQTNMNVTGPGIPSYGASVEFTVSNTGDISTGPISTDLLSGTNFEFTGTNGCSGTVLLGGSNCTLSIRPKATTNGAISSTLQVSATPGGSDTVALSGTASGFPPPCEVAGGMMYAGHCWEPTGVRAGNNEISCTTYCGNTGRTCNSSVMQAISQTDAGNIVHLFHPGVGLTSAGDAPAFRWSAGTGNLNIESGTCSHNDNEAGRERYCVCTPEP